MPRIGHEELKPEGLYVHPHYPPPTDTHSMYSHGKNDRCFVSKIGYFADLGIKYWHIGQYTRNYLQFFSPEYPTKDVSF